MCSICGCQEEQGPPDRHHDHSYRQRPAGHQDGGRGKIAVESDILARNNRFAAENRALFDAHRVLALNLVSSPGAGKTTLLERTLRDLAGSLRCAVIEGDQQTEIDALRIAATGVPAVQINTGAGCHLDAHQVGHALERFDLASLDILFIENVGNLVCTASFDLGERHKVAVLSVTEGEEKPLKYPHLFHAAGCLLLNKTDLLPHLDFDLSRCREMVRRVNPGSTILEVSARSGEGMERWYGWLAAELAASRGEASH